MEAYPYQRALLEAVTGATDVMLVYLDPAFNFVWVNAPYAETCQMRPEDMIGRNHFDLYPHPENEAIFRKVRDSGEAVFFKDRPFEFPDQPERGVTYWDWSLAPVKNAAGKVEGLVFSLRETTKYKRAELRLAERQQELYDFIEHAPVSIAMLDREMNYLVYSKRWLADYGRGYSDLMGRNHYRVHPDLPEAWKAAHRRALAGETVENDEDRWHPVDGLERCLHWVVVPWRDERGEVGGIIISAEDISERKRAEKELQDANKRKDEFLAMLAHELRNPLVPIRNAAHVLGTTEVTPERLNWAHNIIEGQVHHLSRLLDDLLDISRIAHGKITLRKERMDLADVVREAHGWIEPGISAKGHVFEVRLPETRVVLEGDRARLIQVLQNLIANSVKFTPPGGHIAVSSRIVGGEVEIEVKDDGQGIAPEVLGEVFELFRQGQQTLDRSEGGMGVGLTLVRGLVTLHGGRVTVDSAGLGQGATFTVHLPLAPAAQDSAEPAATVLPAAAKMRVLVVDDAPAIVESTAVMLESNGYRVRIAGSGAEALAQVRSFRPSAVLLDIGLPDQDGYAVARQIRQMAEGTDALLLAVSGYGDNETILRSREAGFDAHLVKPVEVRKLLALLAERGRKEP